MFDEEDAPYTMELQEVSAHIVIKLKRTSYKQKTKQEDIAYRSNQFVNACIE